MSNKKNYEQAIKKEQDQINNLKRIINSNNRENIEAEISMREQQIENLRNLIDNC